MASIEACDVVLLSARRIPPILSGSNLRTWEGVSFSAAITAPSGIKFSDAELSSLLFSVTRYLRTLDAASLTSDA